MINKFKKQNLSTKIMIIIGIFFILCVIGCSGVANPDDTEVVEVTKNPDEKPTDTKELKTIVAGDIIKAYEENEIAADELYKNKTYKIKGYVDNISEVLGSLSVTLLGDDDFSITAVRLSLKDSDKPIVAKLTKGQEIIVQGTIEGMGFDVTVKDVKFIEYGEDKNE